MSTEKVQLSDLELMKSYLDGDVKSFEIFYERHGGKLFNFIKKVLYGNEADAKDVVQVIWSEWFNLCLAGNKTAEELAPKYLFKIGKNKATDYLRANYSRDAMLDKLTIEAESFDEGIGGANDFDREVPLITTVYGAIDQQLESVENQLNVAKNEFDRKRITNQLTKVQALAEQQKQVFDLTWMGYSRKDISEISGLTPDVVRSRGLQLRDLLSDFDINL